MWSVTGALSVAVPTAAAFRPKPFLVSSNLLPNQTKKLHLSPPQPPALSSHFSSSSFKTAATSVQQQSDDKKVSPLHSLLLLLLDTIKPRSLRF